MKKSRVVFLVLWMLVFSVGIGINYIKYDIWDWISILSLAFLPLIIMMSKRFVHKSEEKKKRDFAQEYGQKQQPTTKTLPFKNDTTTIPVPRNAFTDVKLHPDLENLVWFLNGPRQNYTPCAPSSIYQNEYFTVSRSSEIEPSVIDSTLPVEPAFSSEDVPRPSYYPRYSTLSPKQRYKYLQVLENPYLESNDIGYVFLLYYGLERQLLGDNFNQAVSVILKLRDTFTNHSFQAYSSTAVILTSIGKERPDMLGLFLGSLDKEYECNIPIDVFLLAKAVINQGLTPEEVMRYAKDFEFTNKLYINKVPDLFLHNLTASMQHEFFSNHLPLDLLFKKDYTKISYPIFANMSLFEESTISLPSLMQNSDFRLAGKKVLLDAHELTKKEMALRRKTDK